MRSILGRPLATLVLGGGGAKGAWQAGFLAALIEMGWVFDRVLGTSVGAINGIAIAQGRGELLPDLWRRMRESDVHTPRGWLRASYRLARGETSVFTNRQLRALIERELSWGPIKIPLHVGKVGLRSGRFALVPVYGPDQTDHVWASCAIPLLWEPVVGADDAWVDGGLRETVPLGPAWDFAPQALMVVACSPLDLPAADPAWNAIGVGSRSLEIAMNEIALNDIRETDERNAVVEQAARAGVVIRKRNGEPLRFAPLRVFAPAEPQGDTLDFSERAIDSRLESGYRAGRKAA